MKTTYKVTVAILVLLVVCTMGYVYYRHYTSPQTRLNGVESASTKEQSTKVPVGIKGVEQEITWLLYENGETGIKFYYPPGTSVSEYSYSNDNSAIFTVDVYDPVLRTTIFNSYLESSSCEYSGIKGEKVTVASTTFDRFTDDYGGDLIYDRYKVNKNGGCYSINLIYSRDSVSSKEKAENILKSLVFTTF